VNIKGGRKCTVSIEREGNVQCLLSGKEIVSCMR
jgi:hypothetical protein